MPPLSVGAWLQQARTEIAAILNLDANGARVEAQALASHSLQVGRTWLIAHGPDPLTAAQHQHLDSLLQQRLAGTPIAHLTGQREFYGRTFKVTADTLIPRPETEHLVEAALNCGAMQSPLDVLDIGTGTGCIAITLKRERPAWQVTGVDISPAALAVARANAETLDARIEWRESDLFAALAGRQFDLIVSNPPYIAEADPHLQQGDVRFEPRTALASGHTGLDTLLRLSRLAPAYLKNAGWLLCEHGFEQGAAVRDLLAGAGFRHIKTLPDLAGLARVTLGQHSP